MIKYKYLLIVFLLNFFLKSAYSQSCTTNSNNTGSCTGPLNVTSTGSTVTNSGTITTITTGSSYAIGISDNSISGGNTILNTNLISVTSVYVSYGINNSSTNEQVTNSGTINVVGVNSSFAYTSGKANNTFTNTSTGTITVTSGVAYGIYGYSGSSNLTVANAGTISSITAIGGYSAPAIVSNGSNLLLTNSGTISATSAGSNGATGITSSGSGAIITNANTGVISATSTTNTGNATGYGINNTGSNLTFSNSGTLSGTSQYLYGYAFNNNGSNLTFSNSSTGTVSGTSTTSTGVGFRDRIGGAIIENSGTISGTSTSGAGYGLYITGNNSAITNTSTGTITGSTAGIFNSGTGVTINNSGTITKINNSSSSLSLTGKLPQYYNIIIDSNSSYGKLSSTSPSESLIFGINSGSVVSTGTTYQDVLIGVSASNLSSLTGTYGAYNWTLASDGTNYDLTVVASRLAYNEIVTTSKLVNTATQLEAIRTNGNKNTLTNTLDNLSAAQLESAVKKIQGSSIVKTSAQSVQAQSSFKTALSTVTSPGSSSSMTNVTKTNQGNLTFADLQTNNLYAKIQPANYSDDSAFFDYKNNQVPVNALEFFKSNRNLNLVEKDDLKDGGFFLRTFGSITNYAAINSNDNSYGSDSYGLFGGFQHKIDENLYQGYSLGFSKSKLTLDAGEGNTKTNTIHANVYRKLDEKEYGATVSLGGYVSFIDNVRNISETSEILKSSPTNGGLDFSLQYVKKMELLGLNFYPSASLTTTYGIVKNYKETGGFGSALEIKSHNVLAIKPEIGFTLENNFVQTDKIVEVANFSLFANRQQYLDGHTNTSSIIDENSWSASTLPKTKDDFLTAGIGYVAKNIDEKSDLNFNFFYTQSTNNSLNSSLFSVSYNKTF